MGAYLTTTMASILFGGRAAIFWVACEEGDWTCGVGGWICREKVWMCGENGALNFNWIMGTLIVRGV